jgi:hypothetical protein
MAAGSHLDFNWGFTAPGYYLVGFEASGFQSGSGLPLRSEIGYYIFYVDDAGGFPNPGPGDLGRPERTPADQIGTGGQIDSFALGALVPVLNTGGSDSIQARTEHSIPLNLSTTILPPAITADFQVPYLGTHMDTTSAVDFLFQTDCFREAWAL